MSELSKVVIETRAVTITIEGSDITQDEAYDLWRRVHDRLSTRELEASATGFIIENGG